MSPKLNVQSHPWSSYRGCGDVRPSQASNDGGHGREFGGGTPTDTGETQMPPKCNVSAKTGGHEVKNTWKNRRSCSCVVSCRWNRMSERKYLIFRRLSPFFTIFQRFFTPCFRRIMLIVRLLGNMHTHRRHIVLFAECRFQSLGQFSGGKMRATGRFGGMERGVGVGEIGETKRAKLGIDNEGAFVSVSSPSRGLGDRMERGKTALICRVRVGAAAKITSNVIPYSAGWFVPMTGRTFNQRKLC